MYFQAQDVCMHVYTQGLATKILLECTIIVYMHDIVYTCKHQFVSPLHEPVISSLEHVSLSLNVPHHLLQLRHCLFRDRLATQFALQLSSTTALLK